MMVRNTVVNTSEVNAMVWQKQSTLTAISTGDSTKMVSKKAMGLTSVSQVERNTLVSTKMIRGMAMAYKDGLLEKHITGNKMRVKLKDMGAVSFQARMKSMDNGRMTRHLEKEHAHMLLLD